MVEEFLKLEKKYNIPATYNVVGKLFNQQPDLIERILNEGQEVAFHSFNHQSDWNPQYYSNEIDLCRKVSPIPTGYRSPRSQINQSAVKTIWEKGFLWNAEGDYHTEPYFIYKGLVRLPITGDDWSLHMGKVNADKWVQDFSKLLKSRTYIAFGLHDFVASLDPEKILQAWEKILQIAVESEALLLNFSEAAELFRRTALSRYLNANKIKVKTSSSYITKTLGTIIKREAEKLGNPVIVNIYYLNKIFPISLKEFARKMFSVSIESGLFSDCEFNGSLEMRDDKVSDSKSQKNFTDLIICTNTIEYLFWPNQLAAEICRIGKIGATIIITFPSVCKNISSNNESILERIKHYYSRKEIQEWSNQIGPGEIICMDDNISGNDENQVANWVFIGTVQNKYFPSPQRRNILISDGSFHFPNPVYEEIRIFLEILGKKLFNPVRKAGKIVLKRN
jgi:hypothetical protein